MGTLVKICGMSSAHDVDAVAALQPDAMGFIFWQGSKRYVTPREVGEWTRDVPRSIRRVGVFVDATPEAMNQAVREVGLDVVQWHAFEATSAPRLEISCALWRVVHLNRSFQAPDAAYDAEAYLLDSGTAEQPGGTGRTVDWVLARDWVSASPRPVWLAGGLTPDNVARAIETVRPYGVDVSSGVERSVRVKDLARVKDFIEICRSVK
jgi:phosphoribosylanthranilate isomerase